MRKIFFVILCAVTVASCYKDHSTTADRSKSGRIEGLYTTPGNGARQEFLYGEAADFKPVMKWSDGTEFTEADYAKFSYRWRLANQTDYKSKTDVVRTTVGESLHLTAVMGNPPLSDPYSLLLEVTEKATGMQTEFEWPVVIQRGEIGPGLIVADVNEAGEGDLSLLRAHHFVRKTVTTLTVPVLIDPDDPDVDKTDPASWKMPDPIIKYNLFSAANGGRKLKGAATSVMHNYKNGGENPPFEVVVKDKELLRMNGNFQITLEDQNVFYFAPNGEWKPQMVIANGFIDGFQRSILINNGRAHYYGISSGSSNWRYSSQVVTDDNFELNPDVAVAWSTNSQYGFFFDDKGGRIVGFRGSTPFNIAEIPYATTASEINNTVFDYNDLSAFKPLYAGGSGQVTVISTMWVLEEKATAKRFVYILRNGTYVSASCSYGSHRYDMSDCTDFDKAEYFTNSFIATSANYGLNSLPVLFYAVGNKIHGVVLPITTAQAAGTEPVKLTSQVVFTLPEGENVTTMRWMVERAGSTFYEFEANGYTPKTSGNYWSANRLLMLGTYNDTTKEGTVWAIPRQYSGEARLLPDRELTPANEKFIGRYGGFGRITALTVWAQTP